jgi:hypothetical protein
MAHAEHATSCHPRESGDPYSRDRSVGRRGSPLSRGRQAVIGQALSHTPVASIGSFSMTCLTAATFGIDPPAANRLRWRSSDSKGFGCC